MYDAFVMKSQREFFFTMKEQFGDFNKLSETSRNEMVANMQQSRENINEMYTKTADELAEVMPEMVVDLEMPDGTFEKMNLLHAGFKDLEDVQKKYFTEITKMDATYGNRLSKDLLGQEVQIARFTKGFNFSTDQTMTFIKRQLDLTGKAGTEMLEDLQTYSMAVSDATGVSFKTIAKSTEQIISSVETFGHTTVEEATRISGALAKAGLSFESFNSMVGKFQNFDNAASAVADLIICFFKSLFSISEVNTSY